ncbi:phosphonate ABC transporter substrate-binding protein [Advenella sp. RU8]|uniref:phosphonate ABC transporter substrate-binding protein n=1 Tax=Advenella sp. RU8 TaxID=3399575 RepID=UPI003AAD2315
MKKIYKVLATLPLTVSMLMGVAQAQEVKELNFGIISTESSQNLKNKWEPLLAEMSKKTGYQVKGFFAPDYAGIIQGMRFNKVDLALFGNNSAMEAVDRAKGEVIYQLVNKEGQPGYWSLLITHKDSPINSVEEMLAQAANLNFGNGDPNSTSGYLVPGYYVFAQNNVEPNKIFKRSMNGNHEVNALSVANKQLDVATFNTGAMERLKKNSPDKAEKLKVIWKSPLIPDNPIVWRTDLSDDAKRAIKMFFDAYGDEAVDMKVLNDMGLSKFKPSDNDQLLPIRQLDLFKQRSAIVSDEKLSAAQKEEKIAPLDAELEKISLRMKELGKTPS